MTKCARYSREGKILVPTTDAEFAEGIEKGHFAKSSHKSFAVLLFYTGVRKSEARRAKRESFSLQGNTLFWDVGKRLKHGGLTDPLGLPLEAPYVNLLLETIQQTKLGEKVFKFGDKTAYNIIRRVWHYPHLFRLTRITNFFEDHRTITEVKAWTGLTVKSLDAYAGKVAIRDMGKSLIKTH